MTGDAGGIRVVECKFCGERAAVYHEAPKWPVKLILGSFLLFGGQMVLEIIAPAMSFSRDITISASVICGLVGWPAFVFGKKSMYECTHCARSWTTTE